MVRRHLPSVALMLALVLPSASCRPAPDLREMLEVTDVTTGWFDAGIVDGRNKIVPSVTFRLRQRGENRVDRVSLNVLFRHPPLEGTDTEEEWDEVYVQSAAFQDGQTPPLVVRTEKGYTGEPPQSRMDLLQHTMFRDVRARVFARYGAGQWVELAVLDVERQLLIR
jgi:hypothetical protein